MDQSHVGYTYWQAPMRQALPGLQYVATLERSLAGDMGVTIQNSNATVPGDDMYHTLSSDVLTFTPFDPYGVSSQWIDIFSMGTNAFAWNITSNASFVSFSQTSGFISPNSSDLRIYASVDWENCPPGSGMVLVNISSSENTSTQYIAQTEYGTQYAMPQLMLPYNHTQAPSSFSGFVESDATISIELEHFSAITGNSSTVSYNVIPGLSRTLSGVTLFPVTADSQSTDSGPALEYNLYTFTNSTPGGVVNVTIITTPSQNTIPARPLKYAVQFDQQDAQTVQYIIDQPAGALPLGWDAAVSDSAWTSTTNFTYAGAGAHTLKVWALEPGLVLNSAWINLGGILPSYLGPPESMRI